MRLISQLITICSITLFTTLAGAAEWGYSGQDTHYPPAKWGHLKGSTLCGKGTAQSPINIPSSEVAASTFSVTTQYGGDYVELTNNGHAVVAQGGRFIEIITNKEDEHATPHTYELLQFHFHSLSEHTVSLSPLDTPKHYDMEMHLVHKDEQGKLAVIGLFIEEGAHNDVLGKVFDNLPHADSHGSVHSKEKQMSLKQSERLVADYEMLLPESGDIFVYEGSLTTPPCSEGVQWMVYSTPVQMSREQIQNYRKLFVENGVPYHTNRPVQALNGRKIRFGMVE